MKTYTADSIRIVPPSPSGGMTKTNGTKVMAGDVEIQRVQCVTLHCEVGDIWRATIECIVEPPADLLAKATIRVKPPERWYSKLLRRINGEHRDVTSLQSQWVELEQ